MTRSPEPLHGVYPIGSGTTLILSGLRSFLVVSLDDEAKMMVFQWRNAGNGIPGTWVSRRLCDAMDPELAVLGLLFGGARYTDPFEAMEKELEIARQAWYRKQNVMKKEVKLRTRKAMSPPGRKSRVKR